MFIYLARSIRSSINILSQILNLSVNQQDPAVLMYNKHSQYNFNRTTFFLCRKNPTTEKEVMTKTGLDTMKKIAEVPEYVFYNVLPVP
jgi:hypothetical protein